MNVISLQNIEKSYGTRLLFKEVNITFTTEKRLGLVGINGTGKSTFLKILAGQMEADKGTIERNGKEMCIRDRFRSVTKIHRQ